MTSKYSMKMKKKIMNNQMNNEKMKMMKNDNYRKAINNENNDNK